MQPEATNDGPKRKAAASHYNRFTKTRHPVTQDGVDFYLANASRPVAPQPVHSNYWAPAASRYTADPAALSDEDTVGLGEDDMP